MTVSEKQTMTFVQIEKRRFRAEFQYYLDRTFVMIVDCFAMYMWREMMMSILFILFLLKIVSISERDDAVCFFSCPFFPWTCIDFDR